MATTQSKQWKCWIIDPYWKASNTEGPVTITAPSEMQARGAAALHYMKDEKMMQVIGVDETMGSDAVACEPIEEEES